VAIETSEWDEEVGLTQEAPKGWAERARAHQSQSLSCATLIMSTVAKYFGELWAVFPNGVSSLATTFQGGKASHPVR